MLSLRAVNQFYGSQHTLWNVSLDLPPGMCTGVIGLPGMGKTTLINCITGQLPIESGTIIWHETGSPPCYLGADAPEQCVMPGIGYVSQDRRIFSQLTVEENLHVAMRAKGTMDAGASAEMYDLFPQLRALRHARATGMSPDEQYQLALANALINRPRLLILDEPLHGTGNSFAHRLGQLLMRLSRELGMTVLLAEQQLSFIRRVADRFCVLHRGRNVAQGHVTELDDELIAHWMTLDARR